MELGSRRRIESSVGVLAVRDSEPQAGRNCGADAG